MSQFANEPSGPIFWDQLHCSGDESKLTECSFSLIHMCSHQQDIGISCHCKYIDLVLHWCIKSATTSISVIIVAGSSTVTLPAHNTPLICSYVTASYAMLSMH